MHKMLLNKLEYRKCDKWGCGHYQAPRGDREHNGADLACKPGTSIQVPFSGRVINVGWAYSEKEREHLRYVGVRYSEKWYCRIFYIEPVVKAGQFLEKGDIIGFSLELGQIFHGITEHVHFEVYRLKDKNGSERNKRNFLYTDPTAVLEAL